MAGKPYACGLDPDTDDLAPIGDAPFWDMDCTASGEKRPWEQRGFFVIPLKEAPHANIYTNRATVYTSSEENGHLGDYNSDGFVETSEDVPGRKGAKQ